MSNYTPGPWHVIPHPKYPQGKSRIDNNSEASWGDFGQIAYVAPNNAHLIAAAPDMLEALANLELLARDLLLRIDGGKAEFSERLPCEIVKAREALKKARGEE